MQQGMSDDDMEREAEEAFNRGVNSLDVGDLQGARTGFAMATMLYKRLEMEREFLMSSLYLGDTLAHLELPDEALQNYSNALELIAESDADPSLEASTLVKAANAYLINGELDPAEEKLDRAEELIETHDLDEIRELYVDTREDLKESRDD